MKKIGLISLCLASLTLVGCFHIPDEDWLPSRNKTKDVEKENAEVEQAINSLVDGFNMVSTQRSETDENEVIDGNKGDENIDESNGIDNGEGNENIDGIETEIDKNKENDTISKEID